VLTFTRKATCFGLVGEIDLPVQLLNPCIELAMLSGKSVGLLLDLAD